MQALSKKLHFTVLLFTVFGIALSCTAQPLPLNFAECQDFFASVTIGDLASVKNCIDKNPELINKANGNGKTPLMIASEAGNARLAAFLLKKGANIDAKHFDGRCALHFAAISNNSKTIKLLVENGADVNCQDFDGKTALHYAIEHDISSNIDYLLSQHANITLLDYSGKAAYDYLSIEL